MDAWLSVEDPADFREAVLRDERFMSLYLGDRGPSAALVGRGAEGRGVARGHTRRPVRRGGEILIPSGDTVLEAGDRLSIVGEADGIQAVRTRFGGIADVEIPDFISGEKDA